MNLRCFMFPCVSAGFCHCYEQDDDNRSHTNNDAFEPVSFLNEEFDTLSPEERQRVHNDLYGREEAIEETEIFVQQKLDELYQEISKLRNDLTTAYYLAMEKEQELENKMKKELGGKNDNPSDDQNIQKKYCYVRSREFHLLFLRAERFNAVLAARRIAFYFREKLDAFGEQLLHKKITQNDLREEDLTELYSGAGHIPSRERDAAGRLILFHYRFIQNNARMNRRIAIYMLQSCIEENIVSQHKGVVVILNRIGEDSSLVNFRMSPGRLGPIMRTFYFALPIRHAALHYAYDRPREHFFLKFGLPLFSKKNRSRFLLHYKFSFQEYRANLLDEFGINLKGLPLNDNGELVPELLRQDLLERRRREVQDLDELDTSTTASTTPTVTPNNNDNEGYKENLTE